MAKAASIAPLSRSRKIPPWSACPTRRFFGRVDRSGGPDACWPWIGYLTPLGYGLFQVKRVVKGAHVYALRLCKGRPPEDKPYALHRCRTRSCCNPRHLEWGTAQKNMREDKIRDGTFLLGHKCQNSKLHDEDVMEIVWLSSMGASRREVARQYGVSHQVIVSIVRGRTWGWLTGRRAA